MVIRKILTRLHTGFQVNRCAARIGRALSQGGAADRAPEPHAFILRLATLNENDTACRWFGAQIIWLSRGSSGVVGSGDPRGVDGALNRYAAHRAVSTTRPRQVTGYGLGRRFCGSFALQVPLTQRYLPPGRTDDYVLRPGFDDPACWIIS
jgi:hypothetical protein